MYCLCSHIQSIVELESVIVATTSYFDHTTPPTYIFFFVNDAIFLAQDAKASFDNNAKYQFIVLDSHHAPNISINDNLIDHPHCTKRLQSIPIIYTLCKVCLFL